MSHWQPLQPMSRSLLQVLIRLSGVDYSAGMCRVMHIDGIALDQVMEYGFFIWLRRIHPANG
jgi:hypothetical protein